MSDLADFQKDDTIGCGIIYDTLDVFFVKNGVLQSPTIKLHECFGEYYPQASIHNEKDELEFHFGEEPFRFDLMAQMSKLRFKKCRHILESQRVEVSDMYYLIEDYLYFNGYMETLNKFQRLRG